MELFGPGKRRFVKALGDIVESWQDLGGKGILIRLKDDLVRELHVMHVPIGFSFDLKTIMTTSLTYIPREEMNEQNKKVYQIMKGLECILDYQGFLLKKPYFKTRPELHTLNKQLGGAIKIDNTLLDRLNQDQKLISLIKSLKPSDVRVMLKSFDVPTFMPGDKIGMLAAEVEYYNDPSEVTWLISISLLIPVTVFFARNVKKALNIIRHIAYHLNEVCSYILKQYYKQPSS